MTFSDGGVQILEAPPPLAMQLVIDAPSEIIGEISLPVQGRTYDITVDWGDGNSGSYTNASNIRPTHTYNAFGPFTISVIGSLSGYGEQQGTTISSKIRSVLSWGDLGLTSLDHAFYSCPSFVSVPNTLPSTVNNLSFSFAITSSFNDSNLVSWNTSNVTDMTGTFTLATVFNQSIGNWNVSKVSNMRGIFNGAGSFNQPIGNWNVSNVANMEYVFSGAQAFNQDIGNWNVANVTSMESMFLQANSFNQPIGNWNVSNVTNMVSMFEGSGTQFNQPIGNWNVGNVTSMTRMFLSAPAFNQAIGEWNTSKVTSLYGMFYSADSFNQPIGNWNTSNVTNMSSLFEDALSFNQNLTGWCVTTIGSTPSGFATNSALDANNYPIWGFCPAPSPGPVDANVMTLVYKFPDTTMKVVDLPLKGSPINVTVDWGDGTSNVFTSANIYTHSYNNSGSDLNPKTFIATITGNVLGEGLPGFGDANANMYWVSEVKGWGNLGLNDLSYALKKAVSPIVPNSIPNTVTNIAGIFDSSTGFNHPSVSSWNVANVSNFAYVFSNNSSFNKDISSWNVANATDMKGMFNSADAFNTDISGWNVSKVTDMSEMFDAAFVFNRNISGWDVANVTDMDLMFARTQAFNQNLFSWNVANVTSNVDYDLNASAWTTANGRPSGWYQPYT